MATILVLHGPNLALLGVSTADKKLDERASELGVDLKTVRANGEAGLIDALIDAQHEVDAVLVNPGVLAPTVVALGETLTLLKKPSAEVLLLAPKSPSALTGVVGQQVHDKGLDGYVTALEGLAKQVVKPDDSEETSAAPGPVRQAPLGKSIGRRVESPAASANRAEKTLGRRVEAAPATVAGPEGKTLGRAAPTSAAKVNPQDQAGRLTKQVVKGRIKLRLEGKTTPEELASWARGQWSGLQKGAPVEDGAKDLLDSVLLTLMGGAKVNDHMLLAQMAKLD